MDRCDLWRHTPFFVWDPRCGKAGERRRSLVQPSIDLGPTLLDFFGLEPPADMLGAALRDAIASDGRTGPMHGFWAPASQVTGNKRKE